MSTGANGYQCKACGGITMTYHVDEGVTPMLLRCRAKKDCIGEAVSMMYPDGPVPEPLASLPRWEWYRPGDDHVMSADMRAHVARGGLMLRGPENPWPT